MPHHRVLARPSLPGLASVVIALLALAGTVNACVYLMGDAPNSVAAPPDGDHWNYAFRGDNWNGKDGKGNAWVCPSGMKQSPINLIDPMMLPTLFNGSQTTWSYTPLKSNGSNIQVFNNGHTIQVQWLGTLNSSVTIQTNNNTITDILSANSSSKLVPVQATPIQFHFHTTSEHAIEGSYYPMEMHIVHRVPQSVLPGCPASGCLTVTGIVFELNDNITTDFAPLNAIFDVMPEREGLVNYMNGSSTLDIEAFLPPVGSRGYWQYEGSLTTPPCTEGLLWHVFKTAIPISVAQYNKYSRAVGNKNCTQTAGLPKRSLLSFARSHSHSEGPLARLNSFEKGAYKGFVDQRELITGRGHAVTIGPNGRRLFQQGGPASNWTCDVASYFFTNRNVQPVNGRTVVAVN